MSVHDMPGRKDHERGLELAATAVDFELTRAESAELEAHLATCPTCARRAAAMRGDAVALARPLTLLPSTRVDAAIAAEIAGRRAGPQRLVLVAAAAMLALALLGAAAVGAYLLRNMTTPPITEVTPITPPAIASPRPDASPDVSPVAIGESWQPIAIPDSDVGNDWIGLMKAVAATESGFVAVGRPVCVPQDDPTTCHTSAWTAAHGEGWTHSPDQPGLKVGPDFPTSGPAPGMLDVAAGPAGLVAIGYDSDPEAGGPAIWHSPDGRTWERVRFDFGTSPAEASAHRVAAVTVGPQGFVIVGYRIAGFSTPAPNITARAAAWTSPDGVTWNRSAETADLDAGPCLDTGEEPDCGGMYGVTWTGSGYVAVGKARPDAVAESRPAAWTSPDGIDWTRSDAGLDFDGRLSDVTAGGPGVVAVGLICQPSCVNVADGVAAVSRDGSTWTVAPVAGATELEDVVSAAGSAFALSRRGPETNPRSELELWRTDDGLAWQRTSPLPATADVTDYPYVDLAAAEDRLVVVGWAETTGDAPFVNVAFVGPIPRPSLVPTEAPTASPPATPSASSPIATSIDPVVLLQVDIRPDVSVGRMPSLTVYRDGTVLRRDDPSGRIYRLTSEGLGLLMAAARDDPLFGATGSIGPDPAYAGGFTSYSITLRRGEADVVRSTTNAPAPAKRAEAESIIALAEHLDDLDAWLPSTAWAAGPGAASPYIASDYLLKVTVFKQPGVDYPPQPLDRADVDWPLAGSLERFGELADDQPLGSGTTSRCGVLTLAEAVAVRGALAAAPFNPVAENLQAELDWAPSIGHVTVTLVPLLPDDPRECAVDRSWP